VATEAHREGIPATDGASISVQREIPSTETTHGQLRQRFAENHRRPGVVTDNFRTPAPVEGMKIPPEHMSNFFDWGSMGRNSMAEWSQMSGPPMPNMNFPVFDGTNPKLWKHRCETYFEFYAVPVERWVKLATMYFEGSAVFWVQSMEGRIREMGWETLCAALSARFGRDQHNLLIRQFYHIHQTSSVAEYVENFDQLMHQLLAHENNLTSTMITARFVDGLKDEIKTVVIIQRPPDLDTACSLAMLQEDVLQHTRHREIKRSDFSNFSRTQTKSTPMPLPLPPFPVTRVSGATEERRSQQQHQNKGEDSKLSTLRAYRRAKGLCFKCGERWSHSHRCSTAVPLHVVEEMWELATKEEDIAEGTEENNGGGIEQSPDSIHAISTAAVDGSEGIQTIRLWASVHCQQVLVLVDSGSTASFLGSHLMRIMPEVQLLSKPLKIRVADGRVLLSKYFVPDCKWLCGGLTFSTHFKIIPLGGYDIILGMDWLERHSPMSVHWAEKWLEFEYGQRKVQLQGVQPRIQTCYSLKCGQLDSMIKQEAVEQLLILKNVEKGEVTAALVPKPIQQLIDQYQHLFLKPEGLPPRRPVDHAIDLLPGAQPFRLRPYRYTPQQKDEIEKQVREMLSSGVIQQSSSPFASPILLVKKKMVSGVYVLITGS
jgi:hypothetical protein